MFCGLSVLHENTVQCCDQLWICCRYRPMVEPYTQGEYDIKERPSFGIHLVLEEPGTIQVGDPVYAVTQDDLK